jgi:ATP-dependent Clp protease ATP-binding subunit ClpA
VDQHPLCVLLLDEIEKAHPDLYNILLQVMDYGKLTDNNGKSVDFRNTILIMTTNAGASEMARAPIGFERDVRVEEDSEAIRKMFTPEFRNRLDAIVPFQNLKPETVEKVVDKFVIQLEAQLAEKNVTIELRDDARAELARLGFDATMGARPLARVIQEKIKRPLAEEILFGKLEKGGLVIVDFVEDKFTFEVDAVHRPARESFPQNTVIQEQD